MACGCRRRSSGRCGVFVADQKSPRRLVADVEFHLRNAERALERAIEQTGDPQRRSLLQLRAINGVAREHAGRVRTSL